MKTEQLTDMSAFEDALMEEIHLYPQTPPYRRSGAAWPSPGDVAYCGHVKAKPPTDPALYPRATCERCLTIQGLQS